MFFIFLINVSGSTFWLVIFDFITFTAIMIVIITVIIISIIVAIIFILVSIITISSTIVITKNLFSKCWVYLFMVCMILLSFCKSWLPYNLNPFTTYIYSTIITCICFIISCLLCFLFWKNCFHLLIFNILFWLFQSL